MIFMVLKAREKIKGSKPVAYAQHIFSKLKDAVERQNQVRLDKKLSNSLSNPKKVQYLIDKGADANATVGKYGWDSLLLIAAQKGYSKTCEILIQNGSDVNFSRLSTPLIDAIKNGHVEICKLLIEHGANVNAHNINTQTPLTWSIYSGLFEITTILVERGADIEVYNNRGETPLIIAAQHKDFESCKFLIEHGASVNRKTNWQNFNGAGHTAIFFAVKAVNFEICKLLIDKGANVNETYAERRTLLMHAAETGNAAIVEYLLLHGANPGVSTHFYYTVSDYAKSGEVLAMINKYKALWSKIGYFETPQFITKLGSLNTILNPVNDCFPDKIKEIFANL